MTRRCRCVHGLRSARNEYRHPGVPGTRNNGSPASSPNSDQATTRPPGRSRLRSRTPSRTASVTTRNPYKVLGLRQAKRRRRPAGDQSTALGIKSSAENAMHISHGVDQASAHRIRRLAATPSFRLDPVDLGAQITQIGAAYRRRPGGRRQACRTAALRAPATRVPDTFCDWRQVGAVIICAW